MIGLEFDFPSTMSDVNEAGYEFTYPETRSFQLPNQQEGLDDTFLSGSYEQVPVASSNIQPISIPPLNQINNTNESSSPVSPVSVPGQTSWPVTGKRVHPPVERETKVKKRKQQHQQKDKERRHRINEGLKQLGNLVQSSTGTFARLDQPTIVSSSIGLIKSLQAELSSLRVQLSGQSNGKDVKEEKIKSVDQHVHRDGSCPVFSSVAGAGVALLMIRADDLSVVEANSVLANILGHTRADCLLGTAVWDAPLHSRLYQLDSHGRVVNDNSNPFAFSHAKVKLEDDGVSKTEDSNHIDCLWAARTANGNTLNARVTLSVLKGDDAKPTHFLLCSLPSQRSVTPAPVLQSGGMETSSMAEVEVAC